MGGVDFRMSKLAILLTTPTKINAAAYQVNLSAVNKIQNLNAKNDRTRQRSPIATKNRDDLAKTRDIIKTMKNERS